MSRIVLHEKETIEKLEARSKALTLSRLLSFVMLFVIVLLLLVVSYQRGAISQYQSEIGRLHHEKEKLPMAPPMYRPL